MSKQIYLGEHIANIAHPALLLDSLSRTRALDKIPKALLTPMCHGKDLEDTMPSKWSFCGDTQVDRSPAFEPARGSTESWQGMSVLQPAHCSHTQDILAPISSEWR